MIIRPIHRFSILYILQGSFFGRLWRPLLLQFIFACAVSFYQSHLPQYHVPLNAAVFTLLGIALAIYHGFCNNAAYDRFWEGRKLWGALIWQERSFARRVLTSPKLQQDEQTDLLKLAIAFCHCLRHKLRGENPEASIERLIPGHYQAQVRQSPHPALEISEIMGQIIGNALADGRIDSIQWQNLDNSIHEFAHIQAACERINNTPIPFAYFVLMHRTVYGYCFMLPFGLVGSIGWVTPIMCTFVGYTFMALNEIVDEISEPFGLAENDIALTQMCLTIERQLTQLGSLSLLPCPESATPRAHIVQ